MGLDRIPVFVRVGDLGEFEVGSFAPDVKIRFESEPGSPVRISDVEADVDALTPQVELFREVTAAMEEQLNAD